MEQLLTWDEHFFFLLNHEWRNTFFDWLMPVWREKVFWAPAYVFLLAYVLLNFQKKALHFLLAVALTISFADMTSSRLIKDSVRRIRPCNDLRMQESTVAIVPCGSGYSFTSSHAANHFGLAVFLGCTLFRRFRWVFLIWAGTIAYGQVYVGLHYPLDVIFGGLLGAAIGWGVAQLFQQIFK